MIKKYSSYKTNSFFTLKTPHPERSRLKILQIIFFVLCGVIIARLGSLQILDHSWYKNLATQNHVFFQQLFPHRGEIFIYDPYSQDNWHKVVANQDLSLVYANPWSIENINDAAQKLAPYLDLTSEETAKKLQPQMLENNRKDTYEVLKKKITSYEKKAIQDLNIKGIGFTNEEWRFYPDKDYTAHITGFLGMSDQDKVGQYGLEGYYNDVLAGTQGSLHAEKIEEAKDGENLYLTIDKNVQFYACNALKEHVEKHGAKEGTVIIMQPQTGAILASCSYPSYDPNDYSAVDSPSVYTDKALIQYEPGSVFKAFVMGAALDMGKISPYTTYNDTGSVYVNGWSKPIQNSDGKGHGIVDMSYALAQSLNTGSIFAVQQIGNEAWYNYVRNLGFGEKTNIELAGENKGDISSLENFKDIYSATSSFGQGITVSPLQLLTGYASIANGGKLMKPYIVAERVSSNGYKETTQPQVIRQVFSPQTAQTLSAMLVNVVDTGHTSVKAQIEGYFVAGKTGTAQIPLPNGAYDMNRHKDTFVGYAPASNPQFIMLTKIDEPQDVSWAEGSVVPLWSEIGKFLVNYYQIPPDRE